MRERPRPAFPTEKGNGAMKPLPTQISIKVEGERIVATMPGTSFATTFHRRGDKLVQSPLMVINSHASTSCREFEALAWEAASERAKSLGWIK